MFTFFPCLAFGPSPSLPESPRPRPRPYPVRTSITESWVEKAREYVLTQTVPPTDAECDFSWSRLRCEPKCSCGARLRFGDYTPGRACRLLRPWERSPDLCGEAGGAGAGGEAWDPSDEPAFRRVLSAAAGALGGLRRAYEARVAPPTDAECYFSLETRRCEPQPLCRLRLRVSLVGCTRRSDFCRLGRRRVRVGRGLLFVV